MTKHNDTIYSVVLQKSDTVTSNGRLYPKNVLGAVIKNKESIVYATPDRLLRNAMATVALSTDKDGNLIGDITPITQEGKEFMKMYNKEFYSIDMFGKGSVVEEDGVQVVQPDFKLLGFSIGRKV